MGYERPGTEIGFLPADIDMSTTNNTPVGYAWQFQPVWVGPALNIVGHGAGGAALQAKGVRTDPPMGILQNAPRQGQPGNVMVSGTSRVVANGTWVVGDPIGVDTNGKAVKAGTGVFAFATALEASTAAGDVVAIELKLRGVQ